ncbi:unnamed protein product [Ostreobium quekettii]|uniref:Cyclin N-terminal domain-containing protein n=1 Tax=Ostreobium quekettii TaxID=121088 RepID=A0A8S1IUU0_9CHLO|nr:unnamed protein product [Ostreobium quekettii]
MGEPPAELPAQRRPSIRRTRVAKPAAPQAGIPTRPMPQSKISANAPQMPQTRIIIDRVHANSRALGGSALQSTGRGMRQVGERGRRRSSLSGQKRPIGDSEASPRAASPAPDIDRRDRGDPLRCADYAAAIYEHYLAVEAAVMADPNYMAMQAEINHKMRAVLVDWIVEVHAKFKLMPETLFLTVNLIDRYLSTVRVGRKRLQLVGIAALLIAAKYEEIWPPEVQDFIDICDHAYTRPEILDMERSMLIELGWKLTVPTIYHFLPRFMKAAGSQEDKNANLVAAYLTELSLLHYGSLKYKGSQIAASVVFIARRMVRQADAYPLALRKHSTYSLDDLRPCVEELGQVLKQAGREVTRAVHRKYAHSKYRHVATELRALTSA